MPRPIGYYVHHQGAGHLQRALLLADALEHDCTLIGSFAAPPDARSVLALPDDRIADAFDGADGTATTPDAFHYAPVGHSGVRTRMAAIAAWVARHDPVLLIVDVSVEIALFARLLSVPVVLVRLSGRRDDGPHLEAFRSAEALLAPFPAAFDSPALPEWVRAKTIHTGFLAATPAVRTAPETPREIAMVLGQGGAPMAMQAVADAARATPAWTWHVYGPASPAEIGAPNLRVHGWVADIGPALDSAAVVIGGAGDGVLAAVVARAKRFICLPERRAFREQVDKGLVLAALDLAVVLDAWPPPGAWPAILERATMLDPSRLGALHEPDAVAEAAAALDAIADRLDASG